MLSRIGTTGAVHAPWASSPTHAVPIHQ